MNRSSSRIFTLLLASIVVVLGGFGAYSLWTDSGVARGGAISSGGLEIVSLGESTYQWDDGTDFDPADDVLESGRTVKVTVPIMVKVTGTELKPMIEISGWSIPDELNDQITISAVATPVPISENVQQVEAGIGISAAHSSPIKDGVIDLSGTAVLLTSETSWQDSRSMPLANITTGSANTPPVIVPLFNAEDSGNSMLDFTPFSGQIGDESVGQVRESQYLKSFFSAMDDEDGDLSDQVQITSRPKFNRDAPGNYSISGSVTDSGGLVGSATGQRDISVWNLVQVDMAYYNIIALDSRGRPWGWGLNGHGESHGVADGYQRIPTPILNLPEDKRAVSVEASNEASFVVMDDGSVYSFGYDILGQLGNGSSGSTAEPRQITFPGNPTIVDVEAFGYSIAALASDGSVYTWGDGAYAALGLGNALSQQTPQKIAVSNAVDISMGLYGGIALTSAGRAVVWGSNWYGQNGDGTTNVTNGSHTLPTVVPGLNKLTKVSAGYDFMLAADSDGSVYGWGLNTSNRSNPNAGASTSPVKVPTKIENLPSGQSVRQVNAGFDYGQVVYADGTLWSWGHNSYDSLFLGDGSLSKSTPVRSSIASDVAMVAGEYDITVYLNEPGTMIYGRGYGRVWSFGNNSTSNYIGSDGEVAEIALTNLYRDGTGVDDDGSPTALSDSVFSVLGVRRFGMANSMTTARDEEGAEVVAPAVSNAAPTTVASSSLPSSEISEPPTPTSSQPTAPSSQLSEPSEEPSEVLVEPTERSARQKEE